MGEKNNFKLLMDNANETCERNFKEIISFNHENSSVEKQSLKQNKKDGTVHKDLEDKTKSDKYIVNGDHNNPNKQEEYSSLLTKGPLQPNRGFLLLEMFCSKLNPFRKQILIACCLYISFIDDGYSVGWSAPVIVKLQDPAETPLPNVISETEGSWVVSTLFFGVIGSYPAGLLSNIIGRKPCLIIGGILMTTAYIILTFSKNVTMIYFGRFMTGFSQSFTSIVSFVYMGEISSPKIRGTLLTISGVFHNTGAVIVYAVGPFTSYEGLNYVTIAIAILFIVACFFIPETPVYYILKGNNEAAKLCLEYLGRNEEIDIELNKMIFAVQQKESKRLLLRQLLFKKSNRHTLFITVALYFFQINSGITFFILFATSIFKNAGSSVEPYVATIIIGLTSVLGSALAPIFIDRFGRRFLLILSISGLCICMTAMGVYFYLDSHNHSAIIKLGWLPLLTMISAFIFYGTGLNIIPQTLNSEMYSPKVRGIGSAVSLTTAWMSGSISVTLSSYLMVYLGSHFTFWLFAIVNAIALVFVVLVVPETTGKTLTEIDDMLED